MLKNLEKPHKYYMTERRYFVPMLAPVPDRHLSLSKALGWSSAQSDPLNNESIITKAKSGDYSAYLLSPNWAYESNPDRIADKLKSTSLKVFGQLYCSQLTDFQKVPAQYASLDSVQIVIDEWNDRIHSMLIDSLMTMHFEYSALFTANTKISEITSACRDLGISELPVLCPAKLDREDDFLTPRQAQNLIRIFEKTSKVKVRGPRGIELFEPRSAPGAELEALHPPTLESESLYSSDQKKITVIIPSYNNGPYLIRTLEHLFQQDLSRSDFEVFVIDDGSTDNTAEMVQICLEKQNKLSPVNFKYIHFPRPTKRSMGDSQFRAGIARNLGVKYASGEFLLFLDSDILTPNWFLTDLLKKHEKWDVIQGRRYDLNKDASRVKMVNYETVDHENDTFVTDKGYWLEFYDKCQDWNDLPACWKYVCTHSLSMRRDVYKKVGWIKKTFIYYGFEDTDLGFRLVKSGYKLHLNQTKLYHLFHQDERSEFDNSDIKRHEVLSNTAQIFYRNNFDPEIFSELGVFMRTPFDPNLFSKLFSLRWIKSLVYFFFVMPMMLAFKSLNTVYEIATLPVQWIRGRKFLNIFLFSTVLKNERGYVYVLSPNEVDLTLKSPIRTPNAESKNKFSVLQWATWHVLDVIVGSYFALTRNPTHPFTWFWGRVVVSFVGSLKMLFVVQFYYRLIHKSAHGLKMLYTITVHKGLIPLLSFIYFNTIHLVLHKVIVPGTSWLYFSLVHRPIHKVLIPIFSFIYFHSAHPLFHKILRPVSVFIYLNTIHALAHKIIIPATNWLYLNTVHRAYHRLLVPVATWAKTDLIHKIAIPLASGIYFNIIHPFIHKIVISGSSWIYYHSLHPLVHRVTIPFVSFVYFQTVHRLVHQILIPIATWLKTDFVHKLVIPAASWLYFQTIHKVIHNLIVPTASWIYFHSLHPIWHKILHPVVSRVYFWTLHPIFHKALIPMVTWIKTDLYHKAIVPVCSGIYYNLIHWPIHKILVPLASGLYFYTIHAFIHKLVKPLVSSIYYNVFHKAYHTTVPAVAQGGSFAYHKVTRPTLTLMWIVAVKSAFLLIHYPITQTLGFLRRLGVWMYHKVLIPIASLAYIVVNKMYFCLMYRPAKIAIGLAKRAFIFSYHKIYLNGIVRSWGQLRGLNYRIYLFFYYRLKHLRYVLFVQGFHKVVMPGYWMLRQIFIYTPCRWILKIYNFVFRKNVRPEQVISKLFSDS